VRFSAHDKAEALSRFNSLKTDQALPKSVFISRELDPSSYLKRLCEDHAIELEAAALIETSPVAFTTNPDEVDWVFFSSSNAVRHFFEQVDLAQWKNHRFAALGTGTAQTLATYVSDIAFIGEGGDTEAVAKAFAETLGSSRALLPSSDKTLGTISRALNPAQNQVVTCYTTQSKHRSIPPKEAYIFTSPSNVIAFFDSGNALPSSAIVIAIGASTASELHQLHPTVRVGDIPHEAELLALMTR
jgi:uroporphyrinogen-III synthase